MHAKDRASKSDARTRLKRRVRKTIALSKSEEMHNKVFGTFRS
ncbi:hypothetical protein AB3A93_000895 [Vibrio parahaemolyticus]|nr:hypothetical protein [Vibrio parahaemolyticus]EIN6341847.1 hypothetical protein [Vibrio parahaemolyticus]EIN6343271.1 hypothetical protein [Vibrio parahaemolyticus]EIO3965767.1 hypothetical protein [Vibrio parahaemolyticus]EIO3988296.1 hypothetical protein [Vibrio parahaemolyticus]